MVVEGVSYFFFGVVVCRFFKFEVDSFIIMDIDVMLIVFIGV